MKNTLLFLSAGAALLPLSDAFAAKSATKEKPNILLILCDDLGWGDLSCQWAKDIRTPNIDKLFTGGIRLDNFYAASNVSSPSRAGLLTGRYPSMVGVPGVIRGGSHTFGYLSPDAVLIPEMLSRAGYRTAHFGKWHLGLQSPNLPNDRGFDYYAGFLGDMMNSYYTYARDKTNYMRINYDPVTPTGHATEVFTNWANDYIRSAAKEKAPFFAYLAYNAPHEPLQPPKEWLEKVRKREPQMSETRSKLVGLIEHLDDNVGKVIATLEATGQLNNTLIIFSSDNGGKLLDEANNGPNRGGKGEMYEGGIKVPCAFYWKGVIEPRRIVDMVHMCDLFPTLCDLAGVRIDHHVDGISVLPLLKGEKQDVNHRYVFWDMREVGDYNMQVAVRYDNYKLLRPKLPKSNALFEFYDLASDSMEEKPLPMSGGIYDDLKSRADAHLAEGNSIPWREGMPNPPVYGK